MIRCERATVERAGRVVVESISLDAVPGQPLALIGRTGAGKSTLLAAAATVLPLRGGEILVEGRSVRLDADGVRRLVGFAPDRMPAWPGLRAGEFLDVFAAAAGLRGERLGRAVERALDMAGLAADRAAAIDDLPAGRRRRLLLARALLHDPPVLLLDDPFGGLDAFERHDVTRLVADVQLLERTVVATIDDADVPGCFTQIAVLAEGRLRQVGPADPRAFETGRVWRCSVVCRGSAGVASRAVAHLVADARAEDDDRLRIGLDPRRTSLGAVVAALDRSGVHVESAGFDPPWPAQLID